MERAVLSRWCAAAFLRPNCTPFGGSTLEENSSPSHPILVPLALASVTLPECAIAGYR